MGEKVLCAARADFARLVSLARRFDGGREASAGEPGTTLRLTPCSDPPVRDGLSIRFEIDGADATAWMSETEWLAWIKPIIALPSFHDAPDDLIDTVAALTISPWYELAMREQQPPPVATALERAACPADAQLRLVLIEPRRRLALHVSPMPEDVEDGLSRICAAMQGERGRLLSARFDCYAGMARLTPDKVASLRPGDALPLEQAADVPGGEIWVRVGAEIAAVKPNGNGGFAVTSSPWPAPSEETGEGQGDAPLLVGAGSLTIPLGDLPRLSAGLSFDGRFTAAPLARLDHAATPVGAGRLVTFADRLAVRIETMSWKF